MSEQLEPGAVTRVAETVLPTVHGTFRMVGYRGDDGTEHVVLAMGVSDGTHYPVPPLVRLHSECLTGDALGSRRCDCGTQLEAALARISVEGVGALVYVRGHEGRGIGLLEKLRAYRLQDDGMDTVDANLALGHPQDAREYRQAAEILHDLGLRTIRLMSSNPAKEKALRSFGIRVAERTGMAVPQFAENVRYLRTKQERMGHDLPTASAWSQLLAGRIPVSVPLPPDAELVDRYAPIVLAKQIVVAQMAQSLDGFVATAAGEGGGLSGPQDHEHLHRLRALVDAVVIGPRTVRNDDPRLTVREVPGPSPVRVVLDPDGDLPASAAVFRAGSNAFASNAATTLWLRRADAEPVEPMDEVEVIACSTADFDPRRVVGMLRDRGLMKVLVEGGGRTVSRFLQAGCLDRLFVTTVPIFLGEGIRGIQAPAVDRPGEADRPPMRRFLLGEDVCTEFTMTQ